MTLAYWNGHYMPLDAVKVSPLDRGFVFGDGVYEVVAFYGTEAFELDAHLARLARSLAEIGIALDPIAGGFAEIFRRLRADCGAPDATVYLQVTRGAPGTRGHAFPADATPTVFGFATPLARLQPDALATGFPAVTAPDIRWLRCDIKAISLLPAVLSAQAAKERNALETILHRDGLVTECSSSNVLIVKDGRIATPVADHRILDGIDRQVVVRLARQHGIPVQERNVLLEELRTADEIWITSTTKEVAPVVTLDGAAVGLGKPGPVWREMRAAFDVLIGRPASRG
ncbi:D-amino acid aminotransferase (plasmid) [Skermanella mucosa]|uniref:D-amino acid aminotransferase n=1 Tax=Skermanella mucosa TaxID=1789672 RepID=UPI00192B6C3D|nr:D-amino acid aminotransferase [Skermanella mucosa]UEM24498.1 D-amino acid aminotransferase [Skermanella mucosa]